MDIYEYFKNACCACPYGFHDGLNCEADDCVQIETFFEKFFNELRHKYGNDHGFKAFVTCKAKGGEQ